MLLINYLPEIISKYLGMQEIDIRMIHYKDNYGILLPKLFWSTVRKKNSSDQEKPLKFEAKSWNFQNSQFTRTIYLYSQRSEQFLVTQRFLNLFLEVSHIQ